jgi:hypothetical protein
MGLVGENGLVMMVNTTFWKAGCTWVSTFIYVCAKNLSGEFVPDIMLD